MSPSACAPARGLIAALIDRLREHSGWADRGAQTDRHSDRQTASLREHSGLIAALRPPRRTLRPSALMIRRGVLSDVKVCRVAEVLLAPIDDSGHPSVPSRKCCSSATWPRRSDRRSAPCVRRLRSVGRPPSQWPHESRSSTSRWFQQEPHSKMRRCPSASANTVRPASMRRAPRDVLSTHYT